jgi:hypothetical protein
MTRNPYTLAYARGYYYGRAYCGQEPETPMSMEDLYWRDTVGFNDGLAAGKRDFQDLDLTAQAMSQDPVDQL